MNGDGKYNVNDFLDMKNEDILKENGGKKFSILLSNPPYDNGLHERFLEKYLDLSNIIISIQPTSWLLSKKKNKKIINKLNNNENLSEINVIDGAKYFDCGILGQLSINYINLNKKKKIIVNNEIDNYTSEYDSYEKITQYSINELYNKINTYVENLYKKDNLDNHVIHIWRDNNRTETLKNKNLPILRINPIRGNVNQKTGKRSDDFYTLFSNNLNEINNKVLLNTDRLFERDKKDKKFLINYCFIFDNKKERDNFFNYCKTDFCRICLTLIKNNVHFDRGELKYVPWFDFSDEHFSKSPREIDDWLFKKYNISDEIRKHIEEILPDYYGIRK